MVGSNKALNDYVFKAGGISRTALNVMAGIGIFIFGWLILFVYQLLGKSKLGWVYLITFGVCAIVLGRIWVEFWFIGIIIYIAAWIHANIILSGYQSAARQRIAEIDSSGAVDSDKVLEKGLLLHKVLRLEQPAVDAFATALQLPGGDSNLLNLAGVAMAGNKHYREAAQFYERALATAKDENQIKVITMNLYGAGNLLSKQKRYQEAMELYNRALAYAKDKGLIKKITKSRSSLEKKLK